MALVASPFGFACKQHPTGQSRAFAYAIDPAYLTAIGYGDAVSLTTNGVLNVTAAGANDMIGIFAGCEYIDPTGKPTLSKNWPAIAGCTAIRAYVYNDALNTFEVQVAAGGSAYDITVLGAQANLVAGTPVASTGQSTMALNATPVAAAAQGQFRIIGFGPDGVYNATLNPFPTVLVQIATHQYVSNKAAI